MTISPTVKIYNPLLLAVQGAVSKAIFLIFFSKHITAVKVAAISRLVPS